MQPRIALRSAAGAAASSAVQRGAQAGPASLWPPPAPSGPTTRSEHRWGAKTPKTDQSKLEKKFKKFNKINEFIRPARPLLHAEASRTRGLLRDCANREVFAGHRAPPRPRGHHHALRFPGRITKHETNIRSRTGWALLGVRGDPRRASRPAAARQGTSTRWWNSRISSTSACEVRLSYHAVPHAHLRPCCSRARRSGECDYGIPANCSTPSHVTRGSAATGWTAASHCSPRALASPHRLIRTGGQKVTPFAYSQQWPLRCE